MNETEQISISLSDAASHPSPWHALGRQLWQHWRTRLSLLWLALMVLAACFAPLIANTHPVWMVDIHGKGSSPLLQHLSVEDILWVLALPLAGLISCISWHTAKKVGVWLLCMLMVLLLSLATIHPPRLVVYDQYRMQARTGEVSQMIHSLIPYSPKDYLRDYGPTGMEAPLMSDARAQQRWHWLGTEENGSDVLSRMVYAARIALSIGFIATGVALLVGLVVGGLMGYFAGVLDMIGMRLVEIFEAIPTLFLLLTFIAFFDRSIYMMMLIIGLTSWSGYARYVRAEFLRLREQDFVLAARACGIPLTSILFRHMLPNGLSPLLVAASFGMASAILAEAVLSFLGLGVLDDASWGQMLNQAVQSSSFHWWLAVFPGGAIFLTVFAYNLLGEALRDVLDPRDS